MHNNKKKSVLIITGHPAQVHNFKNLKLELEDKGYRIFWLTTDKDVAKQLLDFLKVKYCTLKRPAKNFASMLVILFKNIWIIILFIKKNDINLVVSRISPYAVIACSILRIPHIALADTETSGFYNSFFGRFVSSILTAKSFKKNLRKDQIRLDTNMELLYLHPKRFTPSEDIYKLLKLSKDQKYAIIRFVSWDAYHDKGLIGFNDENKIRAVEEFSKYARVFISSEKTLPQAIRHYAIKIPPEKMHDVLFYATIFFGEGATMASESAVLGTPAIYFNSERGYIAEEEKYGLVFNYFRYNKPVEAQKSAIDKGIELLKTNNLKKEYRDRCQKMLSNKIDFTAFLVWFIEDYPESFKIMKNNPDYQYEFR